MRSADYGANNKNQAKTPYKVIDVRPVFDGTDIPTPGQDYRIWNWETETWDEVQSESESAETFSSVEDFEPYCLPSANIGEVLTSVDEVNLRFDFAERLEAVDYTWQNRGKLEFAEIDEDIVLSVNMVLNEYVSTTELLELASFIPLNHTTEVTEVLSLLIFLQFDEYGDITDSLNITLNKSDNCEIRQAVQLEFDFSDTVQNTDILALASFADYLETCEMADSMTSQRIMTANDNLRGSDEHFLTIFIDENMQIDDEAILGITYGQFGYGEHSYGGITYA